MQRLQEQRACTSRSTGNFGKLWRCRCFDGTTPGLLAAISVQVACRPPPRPVKLAGRDVHSIDMESARAARRRPRGSAGAARTAQRGVRRRQLPGTPTMLTCSLCPWHLQNAACSLYVRRVLALRASCSSTRAPRAPACVRLLAAAWLVRGWQSIRTGEAPTWRIIKGRPSARHTSLSWHPAARKGCCGFERRGRGADRAWFPVERGHILEQRQHAARCSTSAHSGDFA